jgi:hypothetical protein
LYSRAHDYPIIFELGKVIAYCGGGDLARRGDINKTFAGIYQKVFYYFCVDFVYYSIYGYSLGCTDVERWGLLLSSPPKDKEAYHYLLAIQILNFHRIWGKAGKKVS